MPEGAEKRESGVTANWYFGGGGGGTENCLKVIAETVAQLRDDTKNHLIPKFK